MDIALLHALRTSHPARRTGATQWLEAAHVRHHTPLEAAVALPEKKKVQKKRYSCCKQCL